ncbi:MAG: uridine kinase [Ruminococcaceae bacterium]|nr:uridine kinase [Oscillospiraceae bacterium]
MSKHLFIGIAGGSGSGKTTLADRLAAHFGSRLSLLRHDNYYKAQSSLTLKERATLNFDHPDAFDTELLIRHLDALREGKSIACPVYDYAIHDRSREVRTVEATDVIVLEGILIFENPEILKRLDVKIFVDTDADVRIVRRIKRDVSERGRDLDSVISQYLTTVKPMHEAFVEPSKRHADIIVPEGGRNHVAFEMITERIVSHLNRKEQA